MIRRDRSGLLLILVAGVGLVAAAYAIWAQDVQVATNRSILRQQQTVVRELVAQGVRDRAETAQLHALVRALQAQVRELGGTPITQAPTDAATEPAPATNQPSAAPSQRPSTRPSPSPQPRSSPSPGHRPIPRPSPSSSPSHVCIGPICLPGGAP